MPDNSWLDSFAGIGVVCGAIVGLLALLGWGWRTVSNIVRIRDSLLHPEKGVVARLQDLTNTLNPPGKPSLNERLANLEHQDTKTEETVEDLKRRLEEHIRSPHLHPGQGNTTS